MSGCRLRRYTQQTNRGNSQPATHDRGPLDIARPAIFAEHLKFEGQEDRPRVHQHYSREQLVGKDVLHKSRHATNRQTGKEKVICLPKVKSVRKQAVAANVAGPASRSSRSIGRSQPR